MMGQKNKPSLKLTSMFLLAGIFILGSISGIFVYATGTNVVTDTWMQMISHTEYRYGEDGQIIARLVDFQGAAVTVDNCTASILYPDKTFFADAELMNDTGNIAGDHYYEFTTPTGPEGVYEYQATCYYTVGSNSRNKSVTNSFHLSSGFNNVLSNLTQIQQDVLALEDEVYFSDAFEDLVFNDSWTVLDGTNISIDSDGGYSDAGNPSEFLGGGLFAGQQVYINLTDEFYGSLTSQEKFDGVTYELMSYIPEGDPAPLNYGVDMIFSYNQWMFGAGFVYNNLEGIFITQMYSDVTGWLQQPVDLSEYGSWHVLQVYVYDWNGSTVSIDAYADDVLIGSVSDVLATNMEEFGLWINHAFIDNVKVYEGSPVARGFKLETIQNSVDALSVQLNTNVTTILAAIDNINLTEVLDAIQSNSTATTTAILAELDTSTVVYDGGEDGVFADNWQRILSNGSDASNGASTYVDVWSLNGVVDAEIWEGMEGAELIQFDGSAPGSYLYAYVDPAYVALTGEQKWDDVTYELRFYDDGVNYPSGSEYIGIDFSYTNVDVWWFGIESGDTYVDVVIPSTSDDWGIVQNITKGWHVLQVYFSNYNGSNVDVEYYYDGMSVAQGLQEPTTLLETFGVQNKQNNSDDIGYVDAAQMYNGRPRDGGQARLLAAITVVQSAIDTLSTNMNNSFTVTNTNIQAINVTVTDIQSTVDAMALVLDSVNTTTTNTYQYLTGTLTNSVDAILIDLGVINATVNRIETNTVQINTTVTTILDNQEAEVHMTVFSG